MFCSTGGIIENWMMIQNQVGRSVMLLAVLPPWSDEGVKVVVILRLFDDFTRLVLAKGHPMPHLGQGQLSHLPACEVELGHGDVVGNNCHCENNYNTYRYALCQRRSWCSHESSMLDL